MVVLVHLGDLQGLSSFNVLDVVECRFGEGSRVAPVVKINH